MFGVVDSNLSSYQRMAMFGLIVSGRLVSTSWEQAGPTNVVAEIQVERWVGAMCEPESPNGLPFIKIGSTFQRLWVSKHTATSADLQG